LVIVNSLNIVCVHQHAKMLIPEEAWTIGDSLTGPLAWIHQVREPGQGVS
jgi:hypothetical protein